VPGTAARFADVRAGDPQPLELSRGGQHFPQQLAIAGLHASLLGQAQTSFGDPLGQLVPQPLELAQVEEPRLRRGRGDPMVELDPAEGLGEETAELALEPTHLAPQLVAGQALVDLDFEGVEAVSLEQIRHLPRTECRSSFGTDKAGRVKAPRVPRPPSTAPPRRRSAAPR
jgi:hypothetical protein